MARSANPRPQLGSLIRLGFSGNTPSILRLSSTTTRVTGSCVHTKCITTSRSLIGKGMSLCRYTNCSVADTRSTVYDSAQRGLEQRHRRLGRLLRRRASLSEHPRESSQRGTAAKLDPCCSRVKTRMPFCSFLNCQSASCALARAGTTNNAAQRRHVIVFIPISEISISASAQPHRASSDPSISPPQKPMPAVSMPA